MLEFKKLKINNFLSLGNVELDLFGNEGFILIDAENHRKEDNSSSNGSGKSSIFESLIWCLTGETLRGYKDVVNKYQSDGCSVCVEFSFKSFDWKIIRTREKSGAQGLKIFKNNTELEYKGVRDAQLVLERNLPELTTKFLGSTIVLGQGLPQRFTNNSPSGRKAVLEELSNADYMITQVKESIKRREEALSKDFLSSSNSVVSLTSKKETTQAFKEKYERQLEELNMFDIEKEKQELFEIETKGKEMRALTDEYAKKSSDLTEKKAYKEEALRSLSLECQKAYSDLQASSAALSASITEECSRNLVELSSGLNSRLSEINTQEANLTKNISVLESLISGGFCPTCKQKLPDADDVKISNSRTLLSEALTEKQNLLEEKTELADALRKLQASVDLEKKEKISKISDDHHKKALEIEKVFLEKEKRLREEVSHILTELNEAKSKFSFYSNETQNLRDTYSIKKSNIENFMSSRQSIEDQIQQCKEDLTYLEIDIKSQETLRDSLGERLKIIKSMETFASRDFRGILLEDIIATLATLISKNAEKVYGSPLTEFYQDGNNIVIGFDGKEYEALSGGERQKLDVIIQMSLRELIIRTSGVESNLAVFDEVFDALDETGCHAIIELLMGLQIKTFVITHRPSLSIPYDSVLKVVKHENGIASIEVS